MLRGRRYKGNGRVVPDLGQHLSPYRASKRMVWGQALMARPKALPGMSAVCRSLGARTGSANARPFSERPSFFHSTSRSASVPKVPNASSSFFMCTFICHHASPVTLPMRIPSIVVRSAADACS